MSEFSHGPPPSESEVNKPLISPEKTPQQLTNERIQRLEEICTEPSFDDTKMPSALRVYDFLQHENDSIRKPWNKYLKTIDDWKLYHQLNPDWQGLSPKEFESKKDAFPFYDTLTEWIKKNNPSNNKIIEEFFPSKIKDWSNFQTIEDWQNEFNKHPEWQGLSRIEIAKINGGDNFCQAFNNWTKKTTENLSPKEQQNKRKSLRETLIIPKNKDWSQFTTIEKWQEEFNQHPEWKDLNIIEIIRNGGINFYATFNKWVNKSAENLPKDQKKEFKRNLIEKIFPIKRQDWSGFETIEDWQNEFNKHPDWQGLSTGEIKIKDSGESFYKAFKNWINESTTDLPENQRKEIRKELTEQIFPAKHQDWSGFETIKDWQNEFNKHPDWQGLSTRKIVKTGGNGFYQKLNAWINEQIKDLPKEEQKQTREELSNKIFRQKPIKNKITTEIQEKNTKSISIKSQEIDFSQQEKMPANFINGITTAFVNTTIGIDDLENSDDNKDYCIPYKQELTPAKIILLMCAKGNWDGEFYAKHSGEIASYLINRGQIAYLVNHFFQNHQAFPKNIVDLGSGPSMAYNAYQEFQPEMEKLGFEKPMITDIDKDPSMIKFGSNPNRIEQDITKHLPFDDQQVDMIQSTFVIHRLNSQEIFQTLLESNRITKIGGYLSLVCNKPFSKSFLSSTEQLGYKVITKHGEILTPSKKMLDAITKQADQKHADRLKNKFKKAFILVAQKIDNISQSPSPENFSFDRQKKETREKKPILDLKNYNLDSSSLTENMARLTDSINYQIERLETIPFRKEEGLTPSGDDIKSGYETYSNTIDLIQSLYDKIYSQIKGRFVDLDEKQVINFNKLREQLKAARKYKSKFHQKHLV